ncbi:MAG: magnesium transporter [Planctomycetota bacterium]|nr:MAG: magnesium transporter [Planctomycetota bacterium]
MDTPDIQQIVQSLEGRNAPSSVAEVHPADIAAALLDLDVGARRLILALLSDAKAAQVLSEADDRTQEELLELLDLPRLTRLVIEMDPDDAVDLLENLPEQTRGAVMGHLDEETRRDVDMLGGYEPESAGGIMTSEVVAVGSNETVGSAMTKLASAEQPEVMGEAFVLDPAGTLVGFVDLKSLLNAQPEDPVATVMDPDVVSIEASADQEEAARLVDRYNLPSLPVVDPAGRLKGVITADDIIDVLAEEASEDMLRLAGTGVVHPTSERILVRLRARAPWLSVTLAGTFLAGMLIEYVEATWFDGGSSGGSNGANEDFKALLYFIPLVGGMAGNVGSQSSTIMVRGFATGEVDPKRPMRVLPGEIIIALFIGLLAGVLAGLAAMVWHEDRAWIGLVVGTALPCAILVAAFAGTLVPFACNLVKVDPAYASGPFLLTLNDIAAYLIYFAVALGLMRALGVG